MMQIDMIVDKVIDRLESLTSDKKCLVLTVSDELPEIVNDSIKALKADGYTVTICSENSLPQDRKELVCRYDSFLLNGLRVSQLISLHNLAIEDEVMEIVYEIILQGKELRVFSEDLQLNAANRSFRSAVLNKILLLKKWGIQFPQVNENAYGRIDKKVISKQELKNIKDELIVIDQDAVITAGAIDYMKSHGMFFVREEFA